MLRNVRVPCALALTWGLLLVTALGCGSGPRTNAVSGKVTADGKPVTGGKLIFIPITTGATALTSPVLTTIGTDGTFKVTAGVVTGKQRVSYESPTIPYEGPEWDGKGAPPPVPKSEWSGYKPKVEEIDIKEGANDLVIELKK